MARLNRSQLAKQVFELIGENENATPTLVNMWLNEGHRKIYTAHSWGFDFHERRITTEAPVTTGTVTLVNGDATVTGAGGVDFTGKEGWKFCTQMGQTYFRIIEVNSATSAELESPWSGASVAGSVYTLYKDEYPILNDDGEEDVLEIRTVTLLKDGNISLPFIEVERMMDADSIPSSTEEPEAWYFAPRRDHSIAPRLGLWYPPDDTYTLELLCKIEITDMETGNSIPKLDRSFDNLIVAYAAYKAYAYDQNTEMAVLMLQEYNASLRERIVQFSQKGVESFRARPFDGGPIFTKNLPRRYPGFSS